jgi:hypothetical protein
MPWPALEYEICVWGAGQYGKGLWDSVEVFWRSAGRSILKLPKRSPNAAVLGDLGWFPFRQRAAYQAVAMRARITDLPDVAFVRKTMHVQRRMDPGISLPSGRTVSRAS